MYLSLSLDLIEVLYAYQNPTYDEAIMSEINPLLFQLKELCLSHINIQGHNNEHFLARQTFVSRKRHSDLTAEYLSELWGVGTKRAKVILLATTQNETRSAIMPLS